MGFGQLAGLIAVVVALAAPSMAAGAAMPDSATDRVEGTNPTLAQKVLGYDAFARAGGRPPDVLLLGSSRTVMLDPAQVRRITGRTAYNAGISSGAARELLAMSTFAGLRHPDRTPHLVVLLDIEAFDNRRPTARVLDYQQRLDAAPTMRTAFAVVRDAIARQRTSPRDYRTTQRADGRQVNGMLERLDAQGADLAAMRRERIAIRIRSYRPGGFDRIYPTPAAAFERMLAQANERGDVPFVAITTMHPDCIRRCGAAGWADRRREVRALVDELRTRHEFGFVDLSVPASWGGSGADFYDEIHLRPGGAARVVRRLAALDAFTPTDGTR